MKKKSCIVLLTALTWVNAYQIGDAAEDAMGAMQSSIQLASISGPNLSAPLAPDDDTDANVPSIVSQALLNCPTSFDIGPSAFRCRPASAGFDSGVVTTVQSHNLSPPDQAVDPSGVSTRTRFIFVISSRSHAPPLPLL